MSKVYTCEKDVKRQIKFILDKLGVFHFMPPANGYGRAGIADHLGCWNGGFIAVEAKFGKNTQSVNQVEFGKQVLATGGFYLVVSEGNIDSLESELTRWMERHHAGRT